MAAPSDVEAHPEGEARLPDGGSRREDDEVADGKALGVVVDLAEPRRDAAHLERTLHAVGEVLVVRLERRGDVSQRRRSATLKVASGSMSRLPRTCCSAPSSNGTCLSGARVSTVMRSDSLEQAFGYR